MSDGGYMFHVEYWSLGFLVQRVEEDSVEGKGHTVSKLTK
jgi:hypothetical protein